MAKEYVELKEGAYRVGGTRVSLDSEFIKTHNSPGVVIVSQKMAT